MHKIERLSEEEARLILPELVALLQDAVHNGSSVGFLPPLTFETAEEYWLETLSEVAQGKRVLLVSGEAGDVAGGGGPLPPPKKKGVDRAGGPKPDRPTTLFPRGGGRPPVWGGGEDPRGGGGAGL